MLVRGISAHISKLLKFKDFLSVTVSLSFKNFIICNLEKNYSAGNVIEQVQNFIAVSATGISNWDIYITLLQYGVKDPRVWW